MIKKIINGVRKKDTRDIWRRRLVSSYHRKRREFISPHPREFSAEGRLIGPDHPVFIIAEIGVNHNGNIENAKKLINFAKEAGVDAVKFQKRQLDATYQQRVLDNPSQFEQSFQYLIPLLKEYELSEQNFIELKKYTENAGLIFFASAFDEPSVEFLSRRINPPLYKIASADLTNFPLLERVLQEHVPIILSTGMSTLDEIDETVALLHKHRATFALLHAQSTYPAPADMLNLAMIPKLSSRYRLPVGYSGHELGIYHTLQAVALGASIIERHITLDRALPGPDHNASLEPEEFKELVEKIRECEVAYGVPLKRISRGEVANRLTLRKSIVAAVDISTGTKITRPMIGAKSPGNGLSPQRIYDLIGTRARRDFQKDEMMLEFDLYPEAPPVPLPNLASHWGLKARFCELNDLERFYPQPKFFEFHMSDRDLEFPFDASRRYPQELYVHAPEYWKRDVVDLAADDPRVRAQSIRIIQKTIEKTLAIKDAFQGEPKIIIHVGGMTLTPHKNPRLLFEQAKDSMRQLDYAGVQILPENLPPFGWFFSGLWHCNIFGSSEEMIEFCKEFNMSMCLDLCHAWLYTAHNKLDFLKYIAALAPYVAHLHISDARGSHKEGLQIGEGDIPFKNAFEILGAQSAGRAPLSWTPEIWQGYLNNHHEFKRAIARLAKYPFIKHGNTSSPL